MRNKWTLREDEILVEIFFNAKHSGKKIEYHRVMDHLAYEGFEDKTISSVRARMGTIRSIDNGSDLSHVAKQTIQAYMEYPEKPMNPLIEFEIKEKNNSTNELNLSFVSKFLSGDNPFSTASTLTKKELRPNMSFIEYLDEVIDHLYDYGISWGTVYRNAEINHTTANYIRSGERTITRIDLFKLLIAMALERDMALSLMKKAGYNFSSNEQPDEVVAIAIYNKIYNRRYINEYLIHLGHKPLFEKLAKRLGQIK